MRKSIRRSLPEIIFFCVAFTVISLILRSRYSLFSEALGSFFLTFGLHFSYWSGFNRSLAVFAAEFLITIPVFLIARYVCSIQKNAGKRKLIPFLIPVIFSLAMLAVLCELQVFRRDDFWEVQYSHDLGLFKFIALVFRTEGGRYFSYFLKGLGAFFPTAEPVMIYMNTCLVISLLALLMGIYRLILFLIKTSASAGQSVSEKKTAFLFAFCLFTAFIFTAPKFWEDWCWDAAGLIFGIGVSLSVWSLALVMEDVLYHTDRMNNVILPSLILILACGCNQITTIAIDILITEALLYVFISRRNTLIRRRVFYYFAVAAAASVICLLAPGNFYRLEKSPFDYPSLSEAASTMKQMIIRIYQQISVNVLMMKSYWIILIVTCLLFGSMMTLRNKKRIILLSLGMIPAGFFSLSLNYLIDYMPSRVYAAAFIWFAFTAALLSITAGSLFHDLLRDSVLPVRIRSAYVFLAVLASFCPIFLLYHDNHQLLLDIRSAWFYRDEQIRSLPAGKDQTRRICGVPVVETNGTDIKLAEAFIANYYGLGWVEDTGVCPPFTPVSDDPTLWR